MTSGDIEHRAVVTDGVADTMTSGFTNVLSGKKFTVSTDALRNTEQLFEDLSTNSITDQQSLSKTKDTSFLKALTLFKIRRL